MFPGSEDDYEQIVEENKRNIWITASKYLKNRCDIEDIVQETFIFAYFYYAKLADKSKIKSWLCGIARNKSREFIRGNTHEVTPFEEIPDLPDLSTPEEIYIEREDKETLHKIISELPEETAQTVRLRYFEEKSIEEIAQLLEIKSGTVKSRLYNARNKLELKLKGEYTMSENTNKIIKESIKIAKEKLLQSEMDGRTESDTGSSKDFGLAKLEKAVEYANKAQIPPSDVSTTVLAFVELSKKQIELAKENKKILSKLCGTSYFKKSGTIITTEGDNYTADYNQYAKPYEFYTFYSIFGNIFPIFDINWERRTLPENLFTYKSSDLSEYMATDRTFTVLVSLFLETVNISDKIYKNCLRTLYKRDCAFNGQNCITTAGIWYAPDIGIVKVNLTTPMDDKITYYLADYKVNGEGMGNKYIPLAEGNYWSYKAEGDNIADPTIYDYINKFTVTHADSDEVAISHLGWIYER